MRSPLCFRALGTGQARGSGRSLGPGESSHQALQVASSVYGLNVTVTICPVPSLWGPLEAAAHGHSGWRKSGAKPHGKTFPRLSSLHAEVGAGDRDSHGLCCAGHGSTCVYRPVSMEFRRAFVIRYQPCPENHVASFLNVPDALLLPKEFLGS